MLNMPVYTLKLYEFKWRDMRFGKNAARNSIMQLREGFVDRRNRERANDSVKIHSFLFIATPKIVITKTT